MGPKWRTVKTQTMNPLKQVDRCECFNLREFVDHDMFTKPSKANPNHFLASYPFTTGLATKVGAGAVRRRARALRPRLWRQTLGLWVGCGAPPRDRWGGACLARNISRHRGPQQFRTAPRLSAVTSLP